MTDIDDFVEDFLSHKYDPVKRREYYLRTRKLKGDSGPSQGREARLGAAHSRWVKARDAARKMPPGPAKNSALAKLKKVERKLYNDMVKLGQDKARNKKRERNI